MKYWLNHKGQIFVCVNILSYATSIQSDSIAGRRVSS